VRLTFLCLLVLGMLGVLPSAGSAQERGGSKLRLGAAMVLDFAGNIDPDGYRNSDDAKLSPGLRFHLDYELNRYVSLGGFARFSWWEGHDLYEERSMWFDIGPRLKGHYDWRDFRFYVAFMPGLSISAINNDLFVGAVDNPGFGAAVALAPGVEWWFDRRFALFSEIFGWSGHFFSHDIENVTRNIDFSVNQVLWNIGIVFGT
jgi:hypothetical protein